MAHGDDLTYAEWRDDDETSLGYDDWKISHTAIVGPLQETAPEGVFDWVVENVVEPFIADPIGFIVGTAEDYLPIVGASGDVIRYLDPEEGIVDIDAAEELEEFVVIAADQPDAPELEESGTRGWDWAWGYADDAYDFAKWLWSRPAPQVNPPTLDTNTETQQTMEDTATVPVPGTGTYEPGETPAHCQPGGPRFSASKARSILLKRGAYAIGQCSLKYSSFKWLVVHTGIANTIRTLQLTERQINFLLLNPVRRRGRGITAANIRTVNRTMGKLESLNRRLNCATGYKRTYKRKKSCR